MGIIINTKQAVKISKQLKQKDKRIILAGGVFDILHIGHVRFLKEAKKRGDFLFILLESDAAVKIIKGKNRPINSQKNRAEILSSINSVDYVIILPKVFKDKNYDDLILRLKPDIIATTVGDKNELHKKRQAKRIGSKLIRVKKVPNRSTSKIINSL